ncbi:MAG: ClbS/DfsB family four-helix bundle protein [Planctomycetota bacterium]|jgi:hypothetical protein
MPRPTNRKDLLAASAQRFAELTARIDAMSPAQRECSFRPGTMNRNVRDVLGHVHHWHLLFLGWYAVGMANGEPHMPAEGFSWARTGELNRSIHARYLQVSLRTMRARLARSHAKVLAVVERHTNAELFTKKRYAWTGSTSLGAYLVSATCSHYEWARRLIDKGAIS